MKRACIVGYGRAGRVHHTAMRGLFDVVRIADVCTSAAHSLEDDPSLFTTDVGQAIADPNIDLVVVCTPTPTHYTIARTAFEHNKHVFLEKPVANTKEEIDVLYAFAAERDRLLFVGFNRRYDAQWTSLRNAVAHEQPLFVNVLCRDHPRPPESYLQSCGSIFRDAAVHDLDMLCLMLDDTPVEVDAGLDESAENGSIFLTFAKGCRAHVVHSRHAPGYDQRVTVVLRDRVVEFGNEGGLEGQTFQMRYDASYGLQFEDVHNRLEVGDHTPNVSLSHVLRLEHILDECERSASVSLLI